METFESSEDKPERAGIEAVTISRLAAFSGLVPVVHDSIPCASNFPGSVGSTNLPTTDYPIDIDLYWISKLTALFWASMIRLTVPEVL